MLGPDRLKQTILQQSWGYLETSWGIHDPRCQKWLKNHRILFQKVSKIDAFKAPEKQKYIGKRKSGSKSRKNDYEAKTCQFGSHLGAILASCWGTWYAFRGHFGRLRANLSQYKAILSQLGTNLKLPGANISRTWANMESQKPFWMALKRSAWHRGATTKPRLSHN